MERNKEEAKQQSRSYSYSKVGELLTIEDSKRGKTNYSYDKLVTYTPAVESPLLIILEISDLDNPR